MTNTPTIPYQRIEGTFPKGPVILCNENVPALFLPVRDELRAFRWDGTSFTNYGDLTSEGLWKPTHWAWAFQPMPGV